MSAGCRANPDPPKYPQLIVPRALQAQTTTVVTRNFQLPKGLNSMWAA
jgi:hypothetical protein